MQAPQNWIWGFEHWTLTVLLIFWQRDVNVPSEAPLITHCRENLEADMNSLQVTWRIMHVQSFTDQHCVIQQSFIFSFWNMHWVDAIDCVLKSCSLLLPGLPVLVACLLKMVPTSSPVLCCTKLGEYMKFSSGCKKKVDNVACKPLL